MKKIVYPISLMIFAAVFLFACVSPKKLKSAEAKYSQLDSNYMHIQNELRECEGNLKNKNLQTTDFSKERSAYEKQIADLNNQVNYLRQNSNIALDRMKDLSVITAAQAQSIKKSLDNLGMKDLYINDLQRSIAFKD